MDRGLHQRPTLDQALVEFRSKVAELTTRDVHGKDYVRVVTLKGWMRARVASGKAGNSSSTNIERLMLAAYDSKQQFLPIQPASIAASSRECCAIVFSILFELRLGHLIHVFSRAGVVDNDLPIRHLSTLRSKLAGEDITDSDNVTELFHKTQWKFSPAFFRKDMDKRVCEHQPIPICRQQRVNEGGTAQVWQISVLAEFVRRDLRKEVENNKGASYDDPEHGPCYVFAKKTFEEHNSHYFENEKAAFDGLRRIRGVIRRLGCYTHETHRNPSSESTQAKGKQLPTKCKTTNLLLEYGSFDLRHIFHLRGPPVFPVATVTFWEALLEVAVAVSEIHEFKHGGNNFNGWHADIKPDNIIEVHNELKLADPGFACFKKMEARNQGVAPRAPLVGGTDTYGAPEAHRADAHQTVDIWSFGCVLSMAATWVVLGYPGTYQYGLLREKALKNLLGTTGQHVQPLLDSHRLSATPESLDCFHNGTYVLDEVSSWHTLLKRSCRIDDPITAGIIDLIDERMLLREPEGRISAKELCEKLREMISSAKEKLATAASQESAAVRDRREHLEELLKQIDKDSEKAGQDNTASTPSSAHLSVAGLPINRSGLPVDRSMLKAQMSHMTQQKTSHRFETVLEPRSRHLLPETIVNLSAITPSDTSHSSGVPHHQRAPTQSSFATDVPMSPPQSPTERPPPRPAGHAARRSTGMSTTGQRKISNVSRRRETQNIIQARERIEREREREVLGFRLRRGRPSVDSFLGDHFINRDIKFLVDDAESMAEHWDAATFVLETLVLKAYGQDADGPDLSFVKHRAVLSSERDHLKFRRTMQEVGEFRQRAGLTNIKNALNPILTRYLAKVKDASRRQRLKDLTVIVLTDGLFGGTKDQHELIEAVENFQENLAGAMTMTRPRQVTVQFIQFGDDEEASERLRLLDIDPSVGDSIDCEKFTVGGDVFKMLLGSFVPQMDAEDNDYEIFASPPESPSSPADSQVMGPQVEITMTSDSIGERLHQDTGSGAQGEPVLQLPPQIRENDNLFKL